MGTWIDATIWCDENLNEDILRANIEQVFERYAYGREKATTTGRPHLQFRGILRCDVGSQEERAYVQFLSQLGFRHITRSGVRNFDYVMKDDDYFLSWEKIRKEYMTDQLRPWQRSFLERSADDRTIEFWIDLVGNSGKTWLGRYLEAHHKAVYIPPLSRATDIVAMALEKPSKSIYIIDLPRAYSMEREFFAMVEMLKNGYVYDHRYKYRDKDIGMCPRVAVMCNTVPKTEGLLSRDRVQQFHIRDQQVFVAPTGNTVFSGDLNEEEED